MNWGCPSFNERSLEVTVPTKPLSSSRFDYSRVGGRGRGRGGRGGGRGGGGASNMLAVRNIPPEFNSITHLNAHFARFGMLQNIQVNNLSPPPTSSVGIIFKKFGGKQ